MLTKPESLVAGAARQVIVDGSEAAHVGLVEQAYRNDAVDTPQLKQSNGRYGNLSSLAIGGPDLKRIYMGNLLNDTIAWLDQDVPGAPPGHWHYTGPERLAG